MTPQFSVTCGRGLAGLGFFKQKFNSFRMFLLENKFQMTRKWIRRYKNARLQLKKHWEHGEIKDRTEISSLEVRRRSVAQQRSYLRSTSDEFNGRKVITLPRLFNGVYCRYFTRRARLAGKITVGFLNSIQNLLNRLQRMLNIFATYFCGLALSEVNVWLFALRWAIGLLTVGN